MGLSLPVETWGRGPVPAVLLHGFTGRAASFAHLQPLLGSWLTASALELPGHGELEAASFEATLDAVAERLQQPTVLIGYSQGARLALAAALLRPNRVTHLVLEGVHPGLRTACERVARCEADEVRARLLETAGLAAFLAQWESQPLLEGTRGRPERRAHHAAGLAGALRQLGLGAQPDLWPLLPGLKVPTLLITGERDAKFGALARQTAALLPNARHAVVPDAGHAPHFEQPATWARELVAFLQPPLNPLETRDDPRVES